MSHKKYKKRHSQSTINAKRQANQAKLADEKDRARKRMDPTARTLLFGNLVFLSITVLLERNGLISPLFSGACTIIGVILLILALWFQFGGKGQDRWNGGNRPSFSRPAALWYICCFLEETGI